MWTSRQPRHGGSTWLAGTRLHDFHRRNCRVRPLVLADRPLLHGPRRPLRSAASGVRLDFERVVPWRPRDSKVDRRRAARDLRRRSYPSKTECPTDLNSEVTCQVPPRTLVDMLGRHSIGLSAAAY